MYVKMSCVCVYGPCVFTRVLMCASVCVKVYSGGKAGGWHQEFSSITPHLTHGGSISHWHPFTYPADLASRLPWTPPVFYPLAAGYEQPAGMAIWVLGIQTLVFMLSRCTGSPLTTKISPK